MTSSITGPITGFPGWSHYGATKAAQLGFLRTAAIELAVKGITINAVMPGNIATEGLAELGPEYRAEDGVVDPAAQARDGRGHRLRGAVPGHGRGGYITGQTIVIDGGQVLAESVMALEAQ